MPMPLDEKRFGSILRIVQKKLKNGNKYEEMKEYNSEDAFRNDEEEMKENAKHSAAQAIIGALDNKDAAALKTALIDFLEMVK